MAKLTEFDQAILKAERAMARLQRIREGIESFEPEDVMGVRKWRPGKTVELPGHKDSMDVRTIAFHMPVARSLRLTNNAGATSFTFQHRRVNKVTREMVKDGFRNRPGAARAHSRYIERDAAIAQLDPKTEVPHDRLAAQTQFSSDGELGAADQAALPPTPRKDQKRETTRNEWHGLSREFAERLVAELGASEPGSGIYCADGTREAAKSDAGVRLLSSVDLVRHGRSAECLLLGAADVSVEGGSAHGRLRQPAPGPGIRHATTAVATLQPASGVVNHDKYIARMNAVAIQPDGTRALLTNIDHDDDERARFWSLVEEHESAASRDQITFIVNDATEFWSAVAASHNCPAQIHKAIEGSDPCKPVTLEIQSGKELRRFLEQVAASQGDQADIKIPARFRDGRQGRTQYRIVGELPNELTPDERFSIVREFARSFEDRKLPFVAVMHAPDHLNDEKNWHFHLDYYDRPCRRIDANDIDELSRRGFSTDRLEPGMWDFAVVLPKRGRTNGRSTPLRQNKVSEVTGKSWVKHLRTNLADITNRHMAAAGHSRRVDPRKFSEMGILADPQEHLGSHAAIAETKGQVTDKGVENEMRQWNAVMAQADERLRLALAEIDARVARFEHGLKPSGHGRIATEQEVTILQESLRKKALMEDTAFRLEQSLERARSRALKVRRANARLLRAFETDSAVRKEHELREAQQLVSAATGYLTMLDQKLNGEYTLLGHCRDIVRRASIDAALVEQSSVDAQSPVADCSRNKNAAMLSSHDDWWDGASAVEGRTPLLDVADRTNAEASILPTLVPPDDAAGSSLARSMLLSSAIRQIAGAKFDQGM
ncbi:MAG: MobA/MobL family protein [Pseudomonadota bacterium]